ncbi:histidine--tRNA ligase [Acutalibacter sp. 1XD8-33]|uniref:histidine--tRNA ligase n=1 Tax=Acutalibacter sp. 1XD8-33 TaxID=2320081 RepID=UPI000EA0C990|nr:histidine--tRNA ligase [Acutalibacter sp. 1XD8-33]RKJ40269.1 histidine--tRNA ligase [Acutalibacter sp. 1XD8-33]
MDLITKAPKGTADLVPADTHLWRLAEQVLISEAELNGFAEIRTPAFEHTELFQRGMGDVTDVVEKQMYTFEDKAGRSVTLRPEGTAGTVRAMLENGLYNAGYPVKLYYNIPCYRYEKPQAGRMREFRTFGVELFGTAEPIADAQLIALAMSAFRRMGLEDVGLQLNSIGCPTCRKEYHAALKEYFSASREKLCPTCLSRLDRNPMRILDCKNPECQELAAAAPKITEYLCGDCRQHFSQVQAYLAALGIGFTLDPGLVRGLDYYTRTVFEFPSQTLGFALGGGGRYDGLVEEIGGPSTPALGFGLGMDRLMLALKEQHVDFPEPVKCEVYIAAMGPAAQVKALTLVNTLHSCGVPADCDICGRGLKAQMKYAGKTGAKFSMVLGEDELASGKAVLKDMSTGETRKVDIGDSFVDDYLTFSTQQEDLRF